MALDILCKYSNWYYSYVLSWTYITDRIGAIKPQKIDWWGILFLVLAVGSLQFVLEEGTSKDWFESDEIICHVNCSSIWINSFFIVS